MRRRRVVIACGGLASAVVFACSPFGTSPLSDDGQDAAAAEAAPTTIPPTGDARAPPAAAPCPEGAILCDDFERATLMGSWTTLSTSAGGMLQLDDAQAKSPTRSVRATADGTAGSSRACMELTAPNQDDVTIAFDARFDGSAAHVELVTFAFTNGATVHLTGKEGGELHLVEQTYPQDASTSGYRDVVFSTVRPGWERYSLHFDRASGVSTATVGGVSQALGVGADLKLERLLFMCVGVAYVENRAATVWVDDVVVR